jgi:hypothetical protein
MESLTSINKSLNIENKSSSEQSGLDMTTSIIFYVIQCLLLPPTLYVNILVLRMLKRENLSISLELRTASIYNIISSIIDLAHQGILKFGFPASVNIGPWYCYVSSVVMVIGMYREVIHSLSLTVFRYIFIIYQEKLTTDKNRKQVTWLIFIVKWFSILMFSTKFVIFNTDEFVLFWTSICDGSYLIPAIKQDNTTLFEEVTERIFYRLSKDDDQALITIFGNVHGELAIVLKVFCVISDVLTIVICLNLMEGFLYYKIAKYMKA